MLDSKKVYMILTNGFDPDIRVYKEAKYLVSRGFDVEILCWDRKCIYKDKEYEELDGIKIKRFFIPSVPGSGLKQIFPYLKFRKCVRKYLKNKTYTYMHCHDLDGAIIGISTRKIKEKKLIFDMHEFYETERHKKINFIIRALVKKCQNRAFKIIHVNDKQLEKMSDENKKKLIFLPNYPEKSELSQVMHIDSNILRITYAGYIRHLVPMQNLIKAANELQNIAVYIHGVGECYNTIKDMEKNYKNVYVGEKFEHRELIDFYSNCDIIYCVYNNDNSNDNTALPTKLFESVICKIPIIVSNNSAMYEFVKKYDIGFGVNGSDYNDIKKLLNNINIDRSILNKKISNLEKISNNFIWETVVKNLDDIYGDKDEYNNVVK